MKWKIVTLPDGKQWITNGGGIGFDPDAAASILTRAAGMKANDQPERGRRIPHRRNLDDLQLSDL